MCIHLKARLLNKDVVTGDFTFTEEHLTWVSLLQWNVSSHLKFQCPGLQQPLLSNAVTSCQITRAFTTLCNGQASAWWIAYSPLQSIAPSPCLTGTGGSKILYSSTTCSYFSHRLNSFPRALAQPLTPGRLLSYLPPSLVIRIHVRVEFSSVSCPFVLTFCNSFLG